MDNVLELQVLQELRKKIKYYSDVIKDMDNSIKILKEEQLPYFKKIKEINIEIDKYYYKNRLCLSCKNTLAHNEDEDEETGEIYPVCDECMETDSCIAYRNYSYLLDKKD